MDNAGWQEKAMELSWATSAYCSSCGGFMALPRGVDACPHCAQPLFSESNKGLTNV